MNPLCLIANIAGILIFLLTAFLFSKNKKQINWLSVGILLVINIFFAWFFLSNSIGQAAIRAATDGFASLIEAANEGTKFAFNDSLISTSSFVNDGISSMVFFASALLPVIVVVPLFDILTYIGFLPFVIKWVGKALAFVTRCPKFETFFAIEMMFLGNTEAIAASRFQIVKLSKERCFTIAMMSMSCVTASLIGVYTTLMPGQYILTAIPLNVINALLITTILNPIKVDKDEDQIATLYDEGQEREPFFSYLGNSIINSGRLVLIITANVIAFVGLAQIINLILGCFNPLIHNFVNWDLSLENILGLVMYLPSWLLGLPFGSAETMQLAQSMGTKLVMNEFVVMQELQPTIGEFSDHFQCVTTIFLTSFANFSTVGMIIGCFKGVVGDKENVHISKGILRMFVSGILVSLMSASIAGVFVW